MPFSLLDFLFPKRCINCSCIGSYLCTRCFGQIEFVEKPICPVCQRQAVGGRTHPGCKSKYNLDGLIVAAHYKGPVKKAITKIKYKLAYDIITFLVDLISQNLYKFDFPKDAMLVPIPLHPKRKRWRGFNQSEILARVLSKKFKVRDDNLLIRNLETKPQVGLSKKERKLNVSGAFALHPQKNTKTAGKDFILVDDVYTSGVTMQEACKILKKAGARNVWAMTIALG